MSRICALGSEQKLTEVFAKLNIADLDNHANELLVLGDILKIELSFLCISSPWEIGTNAYKVYITCIPAVISHKIHKSKTTSCLLWRFHRSYRRKTGIPDS